MEHGRLESPDANPLEQRVRELEALVAQQQATIEAYHEQLQRAAEQMALLKKALFSPRRERYLPDPNQQQLFRHSRWMVRPAKSRRQRLPRKPLTKSLRRPAILPEIARPSAAKSGLCSRSFCPGDARNIRCRKKSVLAAIAATSGS